MTQALSDHGRGPVDLVLIRGSPSDLSSALGQPLLVDFLAGLGRMARVMTFDKRGPAGHRRGLSADADGGDVSDLLPAVRVPALILDRAKSAWCAKFVADRMPEATVKEIPGLLLQ